jgi:hypothetical protein
MQFSFEYVRASSSKELDNAVEHRVAGHSLDVDNHYPRRFFNAESRDISKIFVKGEQHAAGLLGVLKKLRVRRVRQANVCGSHDIMPVLAQGHDGIGVHAMVCENQHASAPDGDAGNYPRGFLRKFSRKLKRRQHVCLCDAGELGRNLANGIAGGEEVQNVNHRDARPANAGFAKSNIGVDGDFSHTLYGSWFLEGVKCRHIKKKDPGEDETSPGHPFRS